VEDWISLRLLGVKDLWTDSNGEVRPLPDLLSFALETKKFLIEPLGVLVLRLFFKDMRPSFSSFLRY